MIEFVDHLHEHFVTPVDVRDGRYRPPTAPGAGSEMISRTLADDTSPMPGLVRGAGVTNYPALTTQH